MLELKTKSVEPSALKFGSILCDDTGTPFAVVCAVPKQKGRTVWVETASLPEGKFDVRGFSGDHRFMRTQGHTGVTVLPSYAHAVQWCGREMVSRSHDDVNIWNAYSAVHFADTYRLARIAEFSAYMPIEFPGGTCVDVVDVPEIHVTSATQIVVGSTQHVLSMCGADLGEYVEATKVHPVGNYLVSYSPYMRPVTCLTCRDSIK